MNDATQIYTEIKKVNTIYLYINKSIINVSRNFKSSKYGIYNNKMNVKGSYRPGKLVETVVVFDHGRNYLNKDNKKRVTFNVQSTYKIRKGTATVGYSLSCRYPWQVRLHSPILHHYVLHLKLYSGWILEPKVKCQDHGFCITMI